MGGFVAKKLDEGLGVLGVVGIDVECRSVRKPGLNNEPNVVGINRPAGGRFGGGLLQEVGIELSGFCGFVEMKGNFGKNDWWVGIDNGPVRFGKGLEDIPTNAERIAKEIELTLAVPCELFESEGTEEGASGIEIGSTEL